MNGKRTAASGTPQPKLRARIARSLRRLDGLPGWRRLVNTFVPEHSAPFVVDNGDTAFAGDFSSYIDRQVYLFGGYELAMIDAFVQRVPMSRRGVILDIGANVGTHSLCFAKHFRSVHAFEPNPTLWPNFERNIALNRLRNVTLHKIGLADSNSELTLQLIDKPNFGLGTFSTVEQYDLPLTPHATCVVRHAGEYLSEQRIVSIDAVKLDVQGFEPEVLAGLSTVLERDRPIIWCEVGSGTLKKIGKEHPFSQLLPFEFQCWRFATEPRRSRNSIRLIPQAVPQGTGNYVIVPAAASMSRNV